MSNIFQLDLISSDKILKQVEEMYAAKPWQAIKMLK